MSRTANRRLFCRFRTAWRSIVRCINSFCEYMAQRGFVVVINDHLGHGRSVTSGALYGHFGEKGGLYNVVEDQRNLQSIMREKYPELPYFSHGPQHGLVHRARICGRLRQLPHGSGIHGTSAGISTAMWKAERTYLNMLKKAKGARAKIPSLEKIATGPYNKKFKPNRTNYDWVTSKEEEVDRFVNDPLCGFPLTVQGYIDLGTLFVRHQHRPVVPPCAERPADFAHLRRKRSRGRYGQGCAPCV